MIVDFEKYQYSIKEVIFDDNEPFIKLVLNENLILKLIPVGDCCSVSILEKYEDYDFQNLIDKAITSIKSIEFPDDYKFTEEKNIIGFNDYVSHHLYEIRFKDSDETFKFMLINYSNGYYDGWLELEIENKWKLIILIGLPASGKTTFYEENLKNDYIFFDDFITTFINNELIKKIKKGNCNICIADPRLCNNSIFIRIMKILEEYIEKSNILLILFENDKNKCFINSKKRKNKNVIKTIEFLTTIYDYDNYKNYNYEIKEIKN